MLQASSAFQSAMRLVFFGVVSKGLYDAILQENQAVRNFADSLIKTFKDPIPPPCWKKKDNVQVLHCFLKEGEDSILIPREGSPELIRAYQEYEGQSRAARDVKTMAIALLILSGISSLFFWAEMVGRVRYHEH